MLFAIAEELKKVADLLDNKVVLLPLLEVLCAVDETVVREQAGISAAAIAESLCPADMQTIFAPMVTLYTLTLQVIRLSTAEQLTCRVSSIGLIVSCYKKAGTLKEKVRKYLGVWMG